MKYPTLGASRVQGQGQHRSGMFTETVSIAVIGAGYWGKKVIREILTISRKTGMVSLRSIVDTSPLSLERCRQKVGPLVFFSSRRRHTRFDCDWSSDVCSSD